MKLNDDGWARGEDNERIYLYLFFKTFLVSGSSDRMLHIFNASNDDYDLIQTIDAHQTSIVDLSVVISTFSVKNKSKMTHFERQLRVYSCSTDKTLQCNKYAPADKRFLLAQPKDLSKNRVYRVAATDTSLIVAKDQGVLEVKNLDTWKTDQAY
jgi:WD40 repeat protein